jgi:hypothetical protein
LHEDSSLRCDALVARGFSKGGRCQSKVQRLSEFNSRAETPQCTTEAVGWESLNWDFFAMAVIDCTFEYFSVI